MEKYIEYFINYVTKNYDMNDRLIKLKFFHSLRVAKIIVLLARKMNMSEEDVLLAFKLGLCHDLGRFREVVLNGKLDNIRFDHGSYSNKILYNDSFIRYFDVDEHLLFRKAIYNHGRRELTDDLTERERMFTLLLRDADKIDIIGILSDVPRVFDEQPSEKVVQDYENGLVVDLRDVVNKSDWVIYYLGYISKLYYDVSYDTVVDCGYFDKYLNSIRVSGGMQELFNRLISKIYERRGIEYVR